MGTLIIQPPAIDLHADRGPSVIAASVVLIVLPTAAVGLRLASRWVSRAGFWWDDYIVVIAMVFAWGPNISNINSVHRGLGKHLDAIPQPMYYVLLDWFKQLYAFEFLYALAIATVKFSIIFFMHRIFPIVHFRRVLLGCHVFVTCLTISALLVSTFQCVPIHDFWDTLAGRLSGLLGGRCINTLRYFIVSGAISAFTYFFLLALPIPLLWKLRTSVPQKLVLTAIFIVGLTVCAVSITRLKVLSNLNENDLTWNYASAAVWTAAEPSIGIVSACLPSLRPLFARVVWGRSYRAKHFPRSSDRSFNSSWLGSSTKNALVSKETDKSSGNFNRLRGSDSSAKPWIHSVAVTGGRMDRGGGEEYDVGTGPNERGHFEVPAEGIRVRTTVTVTESVDWQDDLF